MKFKEGIKEKNIIIKCGADTFLPFALVFGLFVILFGTASSGGGFQGGVIMASSVLLVYLGYGYKVTEKAFDLEALRVHEAIGASLYVILGLLGLAWGLNFCRNVLYANGAVGDLISAGTITFMSDAVGYKVFCGVGYLLLLLIGFLAPDPDEEEAPLIEAAAVPQIAADTEAAPAFADVMAEAPGAKEQAVLPAEETAEEEKKEDAQ